MQEFLRTLKATHTAIGSLRSKQGGMVRQDPIETSHPVIRRHPVTGDEALYVKKQFTRRIVGMKVEESGQRCLRIRTTLHL
jgi:sulfonate dioxygenase